MWDSPEDPNVREYDYRTKSLGVFYRRQLAIGTKKKGKAVFSKGNIFPIYVVGLSLLYAKCWLEFSWRVRSYNTPKSIISNTHNQHYGC